MYIIPQFFHKLSFSALWYSLFSLIRKVTIPKKIFSHFNNHDIYFTNYARTSLRVFLSSLNLPLNSKVGVQVYTCHTVFKAIQDAGYQIEFIDINDSFLLDEHDLIKKAEKLDVLIVTHIFGNIDNTHKYKKINHRLIIIEDCTHAMFSYIDGQQVGKFGDASFFSFGYGKFPSIGPGGFICINKQFFKRNFVEEYNKLKSPSLLQEIFNLIKNITWNLLFNKYVYGNFTLDFGKRIDDKLNLTKKKSNVEFKGFRSNINLFFYEFALYKFKYTALQKANAEYLKKSLNFYADKNQFLLNTSPNYFIFPLKSNSRDKIICALKKNRIEGGRYFSKSINWAKEYGYQVGMCPNAEKAVNQIFTIPCHCSVSKKKLKAIVDLLNTFGFLEVSNK